MLSFSKLGERFLVGVGLLLIIGLAVGTGALNSLSWDKLKESHWKVVTGKTSNEMQMETADLGGKETPVVTEDEENLQSAVAPAANTSNETVNVVLYYADSKGQSLAAEKRSIARVEGIARGTIQELLKGPADSTKLQHTIPTGTRLRDINIENGLCTVDFSRELKENHWGGSTGELLSVYSIVNVLTQFPTVEAVQILIDGQVVDSLAGHIDLSQPLERNTDIIK